jgi:hypothetical protein
MRPSKKAERDLQKIKDLLTRSGIKEEVIENAIDEPQIGQDAISRQGEAVLLFLEAPAKFTAKVCKRCQEPFGTNYRSVAYCTDTCRAKAITEQTGLKWNWMKPENERWGGEPPLIIPPEAFKHLQVYVKVLQLQSQNQRETQQQVLLPLPLDSYEKNHKKVESPTSLPVAPVPLTLPYNSQEKENPFDF